MIKKDNKFDEEAVIEVFNASEFKLIPKAKLLDIIPFIDRHNARDMIILDKWRTHFEIQRVPYAITSHIAHHKDRDVPYLSLWKERRI